MKAGENQEIVYRTKRFAIQWLPECALGLLEVVLFRDDETKEIGWTWNSCCLLLRFDHFIFQKTANNLADMLNIVMGVLGEVEDVVQEDLKEFHQYIIH